MPITALPSVPLRSDTPENFVTKGDAFIAALPTFVTELNAMGTALNLSTTTTSVSSVLIGTGSKTFAVAAGLGYVIGMSVTIANTATPVNRMYGTVTSYVGTSLVVNVTTIGGSGTFAAWTIALAAEILGATLGANTFTADQTLASGAALETSLSTVASATTPDIWTATSNNINYTGTTAATGFAVAPQAGVTRTLICAGACSFTAGANMLIDGAVSFTAAAGDEVQVFAVTTTQFRLRVKRANGLAVIPPSAATDTAAGVIELATNAEVAAGTDTARAVTPAGLFAGLNATGTAPIYACRAWVNFNGTGTPAIRASGNVTSITDNGVGDYTVNFTTAMPDVNYSVAGASSIAGAATGLRGLIVKDGTIATTSIGVMTVYGTTGQDTINNSVQIFR